MPINNAEMLLKIKDKSEAVQVQNKHHLCPFGGRFLFLLPRVPSGLKKILFAEKKRLAKIEDEIGHTAVAIKLEEAQQQRLAERGQGHTTAVREAEMFRLKQLSILETRMARAKQTFSEAEAGNIELRREIDELRRLILCQKEVFTT